MEGKYTQSDTSDDSHLCLTLTLRRTILNEILLPLANYVKHPSLFDRLKTHIVLFHPSV